MIGIIDYGMGNLRSVQKAFAAAGLNAELVDQPAQLGAYRGLVLPGVGAFGKAMANLATMNLVSPLLDQITQGKPLLGICLGLQLLFSYSEESFGDEPIKGLNIIPGQVRRFSSELKVPQIGWNQISAKKQSKLLTNIPKQAYFYFVHSYYVEPLDPKSILTTTEYGIEFTSSVAQDNVYAIQFHPEKSSTLGLQILHNFGAICDDYYSSN